MSKFMKGLFNEIPLPMDEVQIDKKLAKSWIQAQQREKREVARTLVNNINIIDFRKFLLSLRTSTMRARDMIGDSDYGILLPDSDNPQSGGIKQSSRWVASLAQMWMPAPRNVVTIYKMQQNSNLKDLVYFDDCSYSGEQVVRSINSLKGLNLAVNLFIVIPFMTNVAHRKITSLSIPKLNIIVCESQRIPTVFEILKRRYPKEKDFGQALRYAADFKVYLDQDSTELTDRGIALTAFSHRVPDLYSFPDALKYGDTEYGAMTFMTNPIPPYRDIL